MVFALGQNQKSNSHDCNALVEVSYQPTAMGQKESNIEAKHEKQYEKNK